MSEHSFFSSFFPRNRKLQHGETLFEVIIATAVVGVVLTAVVAVISVSVQNTARSRSKALATKYTQEGIEYFRSQKKLMGWEAFFATIQAGGPASKYCLATLPYTQNDGLVSLPNRACTGEYVDSHNIYTRSADVTVNIVNGQKTIRVTVDTTWFDGNQAEDSNATIEFQNALN